ncbi:MAG: hypothetical protein ABR594_11440 [Pyrinomonadaceae bacterium]
MFGCTTGLFNEINGRYTVEGTTIILNPSRDFWQHVFVLPQFEQIADEDRDEQIAGIQF